MKKNMLSVVIWEDEDGIWCSECTSIKGCFSQGETIHESLANIGEAIEGCLEVLTEIKKKAKEE